MMRRLAALTRLPRPRCPLCRCRVPSGVTYCPRYTSVQVTQHKEMQR